MFTAVVAEPNDNQQSDGKIYIKQIAELRALARTTSTTFTMTATSMMH
jgi:hypothetical protein